MRTIVGFLSAVYLLATAGLIVCAPTPIIITSCILIGACAATLSYVVWRDEFHGLVSATLFTTVIAGLSTTVILELGLGVWPAVARVTGALIGLAIINWVVGAWRRSTVVLPIEMLVLRDTNTLSLTTVRGPGRVMPLPFQEIFARLPLLTQEMLHQVEQVDVMPQGSATCQQIDGIAIEMTFCLDPAAPLRIFAAPSWQERVARVLRQSAELRDFLSAMKDHSVWQEVFRAVVAQQIELVVRRTARDLRLEPRQLSARRTEFEELLREGLGAELDRLGIALIDLDVMRMDIAEVAADKQGRAYETLAAAELRARERQLQLAMRHIRQNGLPATPEMIETVMMLIGGLQGRISVVRSRPAEASPGLTPAQAAIEHEPLLEREWAA